MESLHCQLLKADKFPPQKNVTTDLNVKRLNMRRPLTTNKNSLVKYSSMDLTHYFPAYMCIKKSLPDTLRSINNPYIFGKIFFNPYQQDVGSPEIREPEIPDNSRILIISFSTYIRKRAALTSADF